MCKNWKFIAQCSDCEKALKVNVVIITKVRRITKCLSIKLVQHSIVHLPHHLPVPSNHAVKTSSPPTSPSRSSQTFTRQTKSGEADPSTAAGLREGRRAEETAVGQSGGQPSEHCQRCYQTRQNTEESTTLVTNTRANSIQTRKPLNYSKSKT